MTDEAIAAPPKGLVLWVRGLLGLSEGGLRFWEILSIVGFTFGLICAAIYGAASDHLWLVFGVLSLVASAAWLSGGVLGFLFGVPRLRTVSTPSSPAVGSNSFVPNTNLEQISDWLTKAIVGATLVQLKPLGEGFNHLATAIGSQLGTPGGALAGGAVMALNFAGGFMWGYLWCSLRIFREMSALVDREKAIGQREADAAANNS